MSVDGSGTPTTRIAVIGGGAAGLTAARELVLGGAEVEVFEASARLGGRISRETVAGIPLDVGAEAFATRGGAVDGLIRDLGLDAEICSPEPLGSWLVSERGAFPALSAGPFGIPVEPFSRSARRALGPIGSLRAGIEPVLPAMVGSGASDLAGLVRSRLGRRVLDRLVAPVVAGVHSRDPRGFPIPSDLLLAMRRRGSLTAAARSLRAAQPAGAAVQGLRGGMAALVDALEGDLVSRGVRIHLETPAVGITHSDGAWTVTCARTLELIPGADPSSDVESLRSEAAFDAVVMASAGSLDAVLPGSEAPRATTVEVVILIVDDERLDSHPRGTGALVSPEAFAHRDGETRAKALTHVTAKWASRFSSLPSGRHVLRLSYGIAGQPPTTLELADGELLGRAVADASRILGFEIHRESVRGMHRARWESPGRTDQAELDAEIARALGPDAAASSAAVGDWIAGTGLASVVPHARPSARALLDRLGRPAETLIPATTRTAASHTPEPTAP